MLASSFGSSRATTDAGVPACVHTFMVERKPEFSEESSDGSVRSGKTGRSGRGTGASFCPDIGAGAFFWSGTDTWFDAKGTRLAAGLTGSLCEDGLFCDTGCDSDGPLRLARDSRLGEGSDDAGPQADKPTSSKRLRGHIRHGASKCGQARNERMSSELSVDEVEAGSGIVSEWAGNGQQETDGQSHLTRCLPMRTMWTPLTPNPCRCQEIVVPGPLAWNQGLGNMFVEADREYPPALCTNCLEKIVQES